MPRPKLQLVPDVPRSRPSTLEEEAEQERQGPLTVHDGYLSIVRAFAALSVAKDAVGPMHLQTPEFKRQIKRVRQLVDELTM